MVWLSWNKRDVNIRQCLYLETSPEFLTGLKATCKVTVVKASAAPSMDGSDEDVTGIEEKSALAEEFDVYDLNGRRVLNKVTSFEGLSNGVYIVNGKKVVIK